MISRIGIAILAQQGIQISLHGVPDAKGISLNIADEPTIPASVIFAMVFTLTGNIRSPEWNTSGLFLEMPSPLGSPDFSHVAPVKMPE